MNPYPGQRVIPVRDLVSRKRNPRITVLVISGLFIALILLLFSCTDSTRAKYSGFGDEFKIELVNCDGSITHSWISTGKVLSEANSDGYYFMEKNTKKLIEVTGVLIITKE